MNNSTLIRSTFLFSNPSFLSGMSRTMDIYSTFDSYNESATTEEADNRAIRSDFSAVWDDIRNSMQAVWVTK